MDQAGFGMAHLAGNSLGGFLALQLAARGRARTVVALDPAGGWAHGDPASRATLDYFDGPAGGAADGGASGRRPPLHAHGAAPGDPVLDVPVEAAQLILGFTA